MGSRKGPYGLLAISAKAARAGVLPALAALAALVVSGCGDADGPAAQTAPGQAATAEAARPRARASKSAGAAAGESGRPAGESSGGRHGPELPQPKGEREPGITPRQRRKATKASITLESPGFAAGAVLPSAYTCQGKDASPPLRWSGVPVGTAELVLLALNLLPVDEELFFDWAVAGLDPGLAEIEEGKLPAGAIVGKNSFGKRGYSLCPPQGGKSEKYIFMLYAIPRALNPKPGFDPLVLREAALGEAGNVGLLGAEYGHS